MNQYQRKREKCLREKKCLSCNAPNEGPQLRCFRCRQVLSIDGKDAREIKKLHQILRALRRNLQNANYAPYIIKEVDMYKTNTMKAAGSY